MRLPDLPWEWIGGGGLILLLLVLTVWWRKGRRGGVPSGEYRGGRVDGDAEQPALGGMAEIRVALKNQQREIEALKTFLSQRLDTLDKKIDALPRDAAPPGDASAARGWEPPTAGYAAPLDPGMYGAESLGRPFGGEPSWSPGPGDQPVEIRDGVLVASRSLPPAGYVATTGSGQGRVYLNEDVQLTEFSLPKWAAFFDLQGAKPYAAYRTRRPAEVRWDPDMGRGELISKGMAEAI